MTHRDSLSEFDEPDQTPVDPFGDESSSKDSPPKTEDDTAVPKSRFDEVLKQRDDALQTRDKVIQAALARLGNQTSEPEQTVDEDLGDVDEATLENVAPLFRQFKKELIEELSPFLNFVERRANLEVLNNKVDGFEEKLASEVEARIAQLPPEEQKEYRTRVGYEAIARQIQMEQMQKQAGGGESLSTMAVTAPTAPASRKPGGSRGSAEDIWAMPADKFNAGIERTKNMR